MTTSEYLHGFFIGVSGGSELLNPYDYNSSEIWYDHWLQGWHDGKHAKILTDAQAKILEENSLLLK